MTTTKFRIVNVDISRCPLMSYEPSHYRDDGSCRCDEYICKGCKNEARLLSGTQMTQCLSCGHHLTLTGDELRTYKKEIWARRKR